MLPMACARLASARSNATPCSAAQSRNELLMPCHVTGTPSLRSIMLIAIVLSSPSANWEYFGAPFGLTPSGRWSGAIEWRGST